MTDSPGAPHLQPWRAAGLEAAPHCLQQRRTGRIPAATRRGTPPQAVCTAFRALAAPSSWLCGCGAGRSDAAAGGSRVSHTPCPNASASCCEPNAAGYLLQSPTPYVAVGNQWCGLRRCGCPELILLADATRASVVDGISWQRIVSHTIDIKIEAACGRSVQVASSFQDLRRQASDTYVAPHDLSTVSQLLSINLLHVVNCIGIAHMWHICTEGSSDRLAKWYAFHG